MKNSDINAIVRTLKHLVKQKKLTYKDVGQALNLSEAAIKRSFSLGRFDLDKLQNLCTLLGLSIFEVMNLASENEKGYHEYTPAQDKLLGQNPTIRYIFVRMLVGFSASQIQKELALEDRDYFQLLRKMEKVDLIMLHNQGKTTLRVQGPFRVPQGGYHQKVAFPDLLKLGAQRMAQNVSKVDLDFDNILLREFYLTKDTITEFQVKMRALLLDFWKKGFRDINRNKPTDLIPLSVTVLIDQYNYSKDLQQRFKKT